MNTEILLLLILVGLTFLGYMVAINSHGPIKLSVSYLMATVLLAGTVWAVVQHVNSDVNTRYKQALAEEKLRSAQRMRSQEAAHKERLAAIARLNGIISTGTGLASAMINADLQDMSITLDALMGRAVSARDKAEELKKDFRKLRTKDPFFNESMSVLKDAIDNLTEAGRYYAAYYHAEDPAQEELRERILRKKARSAHEGFRRAANMIGPSQ